MRHPINIYAWLKSTEIEDFNTEQEIHDYFSDENLKYVHGENTFLLRDAHEACETTIALWRTNDDTN